MIRHIRHTLAAALTIVALPATGLAQAPRAAEFAGSPIRIQIVLSKYDGNTKISETYTLSTTSLGLASSLRIGAGVPLETTGSDGKPRVTFQQFGTQIDHTVTAIDDGRFRLALTITLRFLPEDGKVRSFISANTITLRDGETTQYTGVDKTTGETSNVDVTLTVAK